MLRATFLAGTCLVVLGACAQNMLAGEFWVDTDPGWGQGFPINGIPVQSDVPAQQFVVPTSSLAPGLHVIGIRTKDAAGHWSLTNTSPLYVNASLDDANIVRTVYFWNTDAGWSTGTDAGIGGDPSVTGTVTASLTGTTPGMNNLFVRSKDANGHWSLTNSLPVYVDLPDADAGLVRTEYFWNTDPGWGLGSDAGLAGQPDMSDVVAASSSDAVSGLNNLFIRSMDAHGHWSLTNAVPLYAEAAPSGVIVAAESFWDEDPGFGQGDAVQGWTPGSDVSGQYNVVVPLDIGWGMHKLFIRTRDQHGHWSLTNWEADSVNVNGTTDAATLAAETGIQAYPNPFTQGFSVRSNDGLPVHVVLYDAQGKLVLDKMITGETYLDMAQQSSGAYTAFFWKDKETIYRTTLLKQ